MHAACRVELGERVVVRHVIRRRQQDRDDVEHSAEHDPFRARIIVVEQGASAETDGRQRPSRTTAP